MILVFVEHLFTEINGNVNGAPNSAVLNVEGNLSRIFQEELVSFYHDAIGFARQNNVLLNYWYPLSIGNIGTFGIGVLDRNNELWNETNWVPPTNNPDPSLPTDWSALNLDLNFGLYLKEMIITLDFLLLT